MEKRATKGWDDKLHTFLLSVVTAATIGCFGFMWSLNSTIARLQEHDTETIKVRSETSTKINTMQLDIRDIRERLIRIESKSQK
jgi:Tfp pilus assembly protein PilO